MTKFVLSIDGGGVRGIVPAAILAEIERRTGQRICHIFDLICGTSTGAIIAAGLCLTDENNCPIYTARDLVNFYVKYAPEIFEYSAFRKYKSAIRGSMFPHEPLERILDLFFKNHQIKNVCCNLMICCFDLYRFEPVIFKNWNRKTQNEKMKDALRGSTAALPYFMPKAMVIAGEEKLLVDGGVCAANPAGLAYASAKTLFPNEEIVMLSIGTGVANPEDIKEMNFENPALKGYLGWVMPPNYYVLQLLYGNQISMVNTGLKKMLNNNFLRIETILNNGSRMMHKADAHNLAMLQKDGIETVNRSQDILDRFFKLRNGAK